MKYTSVALASLLLSLVHEVLAFRSVSRTGLPTPATSSTTVSVTRLNAVVSADRRDFMSSIMAATASALALGGGKLLPAAFAADDSVDYKAVSNDIAALIKEHPDWGPTFVRLAWHSSGTYDKMSKTGGSYGGTIRFQEELVHGGNAGLAVTAVPWLEPIHEKYNGLISYADLYTLGGVTAIKSMGGPTIPWSHGRMDALSPDAVTPDGRLPNADSGPKGADPSDADHLREIFYRMGFSDQEIVCLSGAHALGRCHT
jgi:cytochrome c peroxidase